MPPIKADCPCQIPGNTCLVGGLHSVFVDQPRVVHLNGPRATMKAYLIIIMAGCCAASILGPIETLQETNEGEERSGRKVVREVGRMIQTAMQSFLAEQTEAMDLRLKQYVDHTCGIAKTNQTIPESIKMHLERGVSRMLAVFANQTSSAAHSFLDQLQLRFEAEIEDGLGNKRENLDENSSSDKSSQFSSPRTRSKSDDALTRSLVSRAVQSQVKYLASRYDLQKQTEHLDKQFGNIQSQSESVIDQKILNYTKEIHRILYSFKPIYETFRNVVDTCGFREEHQQQIDRFEQLLQELNAGLDQNGHTLPNLALPTEAADDFLDERFNVMQNLSRQNLKTMAEPDGNEQQGPPGGQMGECEDSEFLGSTLDMRVCNAAVRYSKCYIQIIAYHCCRSCTAAGLLSETGPHRYLNLPRKISLFKAL
ncbi:uncharacterized protein [Macrobrachium rosenbergii]|uniref:uncharacterized protein n=1 Tax=Macrobrachium rosenbergii TaxID=79674 RepID=UPI0034D3D436